MSDNHRTNSIVSKGGGGIRWPWRRAQDVDIGSGSRTQNSTVNQGSTARIQNSTVNLGSTDRVGNSTVDAEPSGGSRRAARRLARAARPYGATSPAGWRSFLATVIVLAAFAFHAIPHAARLGGTVSPNEVRGFLVAVASYLPVIGEFDVARWLVPAASAWLWQPFIAAIGAGILRLVALNTARRDPLAAIWIAFAALAIDAATWLFVGLKLWGVAYSPVEGAALITLLKVEGAVLMLTFFILAPTGKRKLGQTDADWNGGA
jgi:hypothetical protein